MNRTLITVILAVFLLAPFYSAEAANVRAFHNINQLPFKQIFGLPSLDNNPLTEAGKWRMNLITNFSNTYNISAKANDQIVNDVETFRGVLIVNYGLRENWQLSMEIPYIQNDGGFLDDFIYDWHDFFSMPQNGRTKDNSDQLQVAYLSNSGAPLKCLIPAAALATSA